jgi:hypothetical protein
MTGFPNSPKLLRGGIVVVDPTTTQIKRVIALQYNPDTITRTLQVQGVGNETGDRSEAMRLKGPPTETIKLDAEFDATDALEFPRDNDIVARHGLFPQLAALEMLVYPTTDQLLNQNAQSQRGAVEILPNEMPLTLFVFSKSRTVPMRITELSVTEEAFDTQLNPIRAKVSLGMRVLSVMDLGFAHRGGTLYLGYQRQKEQFASLGRSTDLAPLGLTSINSGG